MSVHKKEKPIIKKIKPYPILAKLFKSESSLPIEGQILRVTKIGFQAEYSNLLFSVGEIYTVEFTFPSLQKNLKEKVKIVRTMDRFKDEQATIKGYLVEMHFLNLDPINAKAIGEFEYSINQKIS